MTPIRAIPPLIYVQVKGGADCWQLAKSVGINPGLISRPYHYLYVDRPDKQWKYVNAALGGFRPMLFDLVNDPDELHDLGDSTEPAHLEVMALMEQRLCDWSRRLSQRTSFSENDVNTKRGGSRKKGIVLGLYDEEDAPAELTGKFVGKVAQRFVSD